MANTLTSRRVNVADGCRDVLLKRVAIGMTDEVFDQVRSRAVEQKTSFNQQVRLLVSSALNASS